ncbi:HlyD family secretion protein [Chloroflexota bacterium]
MKRKWIRLAIVLVALVIIGGGLWWSLSPEPQEFSSDIYTSGFIEAKNVAIAPEAAGRIVNINVNEGDKIKAGTPLVKLDDSLLKAQQQQAEAAVVMAQAGLEQATASRNQAIVSRNGAKKVWENALDVQNNPVELEARIIAAQGELDMAELSVARAWRRRDEPWGVWEQRAAELRQEVAQDVLENLLLIKDNPQEINAAVDQANAAYQMAVAAVEVAEKAVEVAKTQVRHAETPLKILEVQLSKLTLSSPISGVVAEQYCEAGEIAQPGVPILTITELEEVILTTYVPESKIGLVRLGQEALVSVDSYPVESFSGKVVYISPRALFTPRNIQLKEEREKTVFAIKIRLANPEQKLKPGMPADARILTNSE